jgi:CRP-like cAMP-binding protein
VSLTQNDIALVQSTPLFGGMSEPTLQLITGNAFPQMYPRKTLLFQEGDRADCFYIVLEGLVKLFRVNYDGNEAVIHVFGSGDTFAEGAMFLGGVFPVSAEVVSPARLLRIEAVAIRRAVQEHPEIAFAMLASASRHLKMLVDQIEQMKLHSAPERVAEFLLGLTDVRSGPVTLNLPYEKILIANALGMKPESFSRALAKLRAVGVEVESDRITIGDARRLADFVHTRESGL